MGVFGAIALVVGGCSFRHGTGVPGDGPPPDVRKDAPADAPGDGVGDAAIACPASYTLHDAARPMSFYRWVSASATWSAAETACAGDGSTATKPAHLIVLDDSSERAWAFAQNNSDQWVGAADIRTENSWLAVTDQVSPYIGAASGNLPNKDCLILNATDTAADGCGGGHPYLCECDGLAADATHF